MSSDKGFIYLLLYRFFSDKLEQYVVASWRRVCFQTGLPRLVFPNLAKICNSKCSWGLSQVWCWLGDQVTPASGVAQWCGTGEGATGGTVNLSQE